MKYAIVSNIHGNYSALQAAVHEFSELKVDKIICLGGIVGYGPNPIECIELLEEIDAVCIKGDFEVIATNKGSNEYHAAHYFGQTMEWTRKTLKPKHLAFLSSLPFDYKEKRARFAYHLKINEDDRKFLEDTNEAKMAFDSFEEKIQCYGSGMNPSIIIQNNENDIFWSKSLKCNTNEHPKAIVGVGSVGKPRDRNPKPSYAVYDSECGTISIERFEYDVAKTQREMLQKGFPDFLIQMLGMGR
jgi:hypothetical protein